MNEIQKNLSNIVVSQQEKIDSIEENITQTELRAQQGLQDLQEADKLYLSYKPIIGGALGALVGGPWCCCRCQVGKFIRRSWNLVG